MPGRVGFLIAFAAAAALQGCGREPTQTRVVPPRVTLPEHAPLHAKAPPAVQPEAPQPAGPTAVQPVPEPEQPRPSPAAPAAPARGDLPVVRNIGDAEGFRLLAQRPLMVPVAGIPPASLSDHFELARGKRVHEAIDILAPAGTPVVAVDDGRIAKLFTSRAGGLTIYHYDPAGRLTYYYAHLQRYADGLREGMEVKRGDVIGYVGSTGNADTKVPHLHFAVFKLPDPPQWWKGDAVNPYPALSRAAAASPQVASR
jgi:murein DD-endopeptidase MepM/ murein hydrolase activator NlpD